MARRKRRRASRILQNPAALSDLDFDILVYLHYSVPGTFQRGHLDKAQLIDTIVGHLQWSKNRDVTQSFVRRRLEVFSRTWSDQYHDIYAQGLMALISLDEEVKDRIRYESTVHGKRKFQERIETPTRCLRSRSLGDRSFAENHVSLDEEAQRVTSSRKRASVRSFGRETESPLVPSSVIDDSLGVLKTSQTPTIACTRESSYTEITPVPFHIAETQDCSFGSPSPTPQLDDPHRSLSKALPSANMEPNVSLDSAEKQENFSNNRNPSPAWFDVPYTNIQHGFETLIQQNKNTSLADQLIMLRTLVNAQVNTYDHELRESKSSCNKKDGEIELLHDEIESFKEISGSQDTQIQAMKQIRNLRREIHFLEKSLDKEESFAKINFNVNRIKTDETDEPQVAEVAKLADLLRLDTQGIFCEGKPKAGHEMSGWRDDKTLIQLISCCLGTTSMQAMQDRMASVIKPGVTGRLFLRSLLCAALCQWVFQCKITDLIAQRTPLLAMYQDTVTDYLSAEILRSLDFAAHQRLIQSTIFRNDAVDRRAKVLACSFLAKLSKLCTCSCKQCRSNLLEVWRHELQGISGIFEKALNLQLKVALSMYDLQALPYGSGAEFNPYWMERELSSYGAGNANHSKQQVIKLCLFPALSLRRREDSLVDPHRLISAPTELDLCTTRRIAKALVIYGEEQLRHSVISDSEDEEDSGTISMKLED